MEESVLTVVAVFVAAAGREEALETALRALVEPTRREDGCLNYDLHASTQQPGVMFFHETWTSSEQHRAHLATPHVRRLLSITPDLLAEPIREFKGIRLEP